MKNKYTSLSRNRNLIILYSMALFAGCAGPLERAHNTVGLPRSVSLDPLPMDLEGTVEEGPAGNIQGSKNITKLGIMGAGAGLTRGAGYNDSGELVESNNLFINLELNVVDTFSLGAKPTLSYGSTSIGDNWSLGVDYYVRWRVLRANDLQLTLIPGVRLTSDTQSDEACSSIFDFDKKNDPPGCTPVYFASSDIDIEEPYLAVPIEKFITHDRKLSLVPMAMYTVFQSTNKLTNSPNLVIDDSKWNYALLAYFTGYGAAGKKTPSSFQFGGGANFIRSFKNTDAVDWKIIGLLELSGRFYF